MEKLFFGGLDLLKPNVIEPTKMPRTAVVPVVRDKRTGYLNAAPYSGGVTSMDPLHILFGPKGPDAIEAFRLADEFCAAIPRRDQVDHMWVMALEVPHGINEIEVAGWHTLSSKQIDTPGIEECPLNLECRKMFFGQLPPPWRSIVIGEVVGVSIDRDLLEMRRSDTIRLFPMHEAGSNPETGVYGPGVFSGELIPPSEPVERVSSTMKGEGKKTYVRGVDLYKPENERVLMNAVWPRPSYILMTADENGNAHALPISGGSLQSTEPAVQVPVPKSTSCYANIKRTGEFVISVPDRSLIENFESLESNPGDLEAAGFSLISSSMVKVSGMAECPVSMDCKAVMFEDVPGTNYAILVGRRVGVVLDKEISENLDPQRHVLRDRLSYINRVYSSFIYAVMDRGMVRKWGFQDVNNLSVRPLPSWGSRYTGGWWGPGQSLNYWLIELCDGMLIDKEEYYKIRHAVRLWNNGRGIPHLVEYYEPETKSELKEWLTKLFKMMAWAHRDYGKWDQVHEYLKEFPEEPRDHHSGPVHHESWRGQKV